jgi:hypothetical protein
MLIEEDSQDVESMMLTSKGKRLGKEVSPQFLR